MYYFPIKRPWAFFFGLNLDSPWSQKPKKCQWTLLWKIWCALEFWFCRDFQEHLSRQYDYVPDEEQEETYQNDNKKARPPRAARRRPPTTRTPSSRPRCINNRRRPTRTTDGTAPTTIAIRWGPAATPWPTPGWPPSPSTIIRNRMRTRSASNRMISSPTLSRFVL